MQNRLNLIIIMKENTFKYFVMLPQEFARFKCVQTRMENKIPVDYRYIFILFSRCFINRYPAVQEAAVHV